MTERKVKNEKALEKALNKSLDDVIKEQEQEREFINFLSDLPFSNSEKYQNFKAIEREYLETKEIWENSSEHLEFKDAEAAIIKEITESSFERPVICKYGKITVKPASERVIWDTKALTEASKDVPDLLSFKRVSHVKKSVSIEYF